MADRTVVVRLRAEIAEFRRGMGDAARTTDDLTQKLDRADRAATGAATGLDKTGRAGKESADGSRAAARGMTDVTDSSAKAERGAKGAADGLGKTGKAAKDAKGDVTGAATALDDAAQASTKAAKSSDSATSSWQAMARSARDNEQAWDRVGITFAAVGTAAAVGVVASVKAYADFDEAMARVKASSGESAANMERLGDAAIQAGADTSFSATDAAGAVEQLSKAGVSAEDILGGGLSGALSLAAAGNVEVGEAAEVAASALTQFNLEGEDVGHVADLLASGANKAQGGVGDLGAALGQSGLVASQFGLSVEETVGSLSAFASAGLLGSDAGTSFRTMLLALANPTKESRDLLQQMGIQAYDAQGNFAGIETLAGQLQDRLGGLTQAQRDQTLAQIFGSDAIRAANVLYTEGADGIAGWTNEVDDAGAAALTAAANMDNLSGDVEGLMGSLETALIGTGESADGPLRSLVQTVDGVVDSYNRMPDAAKGATLAVGGTVAVAGLAAGAFLTLAPRVVETYDAFRRLVPAGSRASTNLGRVGKAAGVATVAFIGLQAASATMRSGMEDVSGLEETTRAVLDLADATPTSVTNFDELFVIDGQLGSEVNGLSSAINRLDASPIFKIVDAGASLGGVFDSDIGLARAAMDQFDASLAGLVETGNLDEAAAGANYLKQELEASGRSADMAKEFLPGYYDALAGVDNAQRLAAESGESVVGAVERIPGVAVTAGEALGGLYPSFESYVAGAQLSDEATETLRDELMELGETMLGFVDPLDAYTGLLEQKKEADRAAAEAQAAATESQTDSWEDYTGAVGVSVTEYLEELERQQEAQEQWKTNLLKLAGRVSAGTLEELAKMGPGGAQIVAELVNGTDAQLAQMDDLAAARAEDAVAAWGDTMKYGQPILEEIYRKAGKGASDAAAEELQAGTKTIEDIAEQYGIALADGVNPVLTGVGKPAIRAQQIAAGRGLQEADGGLVDYYADGAVEDHVAQIAPAGAYRLWAEPETPGSAYVPVRGRRLRLELAA